MTLKGNTDGNSRMRENNSTTTWTSAAETSSAPTTVCQQQKKTKTKRPTLFPSSSLTVHTHEELKAAPPNEKWSGLRVKVLANWITRERERVGPHHLLQVLDCSRPATNVLFRVVWRRRVLSSSDSPPGRRRSDEFYLLRK